MQGKPELNLYAHVRENQEDIRRFVISRVSQYKQDGLLLGGHVDANLEKEIVEGLTAKADGMQVLLSSSFGESY